MKKIMAIMLLLPLLFSKVSAEKMQVWDILTEEGQFLTQVCEEPSVEDEYISADNTLYQIYAVENRHAYARKNGMIELPSVSWMDADSVRPVSARERTIALYCTHSDESYEPSDGVYSTEGRGSIYEVAKALGEALSDKGINVHRSDALHHPHDAGAYRRSRQTAVKLISSGLPDCIIDIHRDGIPDPSSYAVEIGGNPVSKIRLLVGRGNQNAALNKEFALQIKAVADHVYPGLIKDIYLAKGTFNQDLLPHSILFECGTYTLEKERVLASMTLMADVLDRTLYGGIVGSAGSHISDSSAPQATAPITMGAPETASPEAEGSGYGFLALLLGVIILGIPVLSAGSLRRGARKAGRHLSEMTGGALGTKPRKDEDNQHS